MTDKEITIRLTGHGSRRRARRLARLNPRCFVNVVDSTGRVHYFVTATTSGRLSAWIFYPAARRGNFTWPVEEGR